MNHVAAHAEKLSHGFLGFKSGISAVQKDSSNKRVAILTVFNRVTAEDSGLRFKLLIPVSEIDCVDGRVNLLGRSVETMVQCNEIVITKVLGTQGTHDADIYGAQYPTVSKYGRDCFV